LQHACIFGRLAICLTRFKLFHRQISHSFHHFSRLVVSSASQVLNSAASRRVVPAVDQD
jgi:hypothetical protein